MNLAWRDKVYIDYLVPRVVLRTLRPKCHIDIVVSNPDDCLIDIHADAFPSSASLLPVGPYGRFHFRHSVFAGPRCELLLFYMPCEKVTYSE
jgi:hypothetical protein